eukprot:gene4797-8669_t
MALSSILQTSITILVIYFIVFTNEAYAESEDLANSTNPDASGCKDLSITRAVQDSAWVGASIGAGFLAAFMVATLLFTCECSGKALDASCLVVACECFPDECCADVEGDDVFGSDDRINAKPSNSINHQCDIFTLSDANGNMSTSLKSVAVVDEPRLQTEDPANILRLETSKEETGSSNHMTTSENVLDFQESGEFGAFLALVEFLDAIPESLVLSDALARGRLQTALIVSIVVLNFSTGFAMFSDLIRSPDSTIHTSHRIHQVLFLSATVAAGMLIFAVSDEIYAGFTEKEGSERGLSLGLLIAGTIVGGGLVLSLMWFSAAQGAANLKARVRGYFRCCSVETFVWSRGRALFIDTGRVAKSLMLVIALTLWLMLLTISGTLIFRRDTVEKDFIEGFSGGAFIITIGGTLLPEGSIAAQRSGWSGVRKQMLAASSFLFGLMIAVILKLLDSDDDSVCG